MPGLNTFCEPGGMRSSATVTCRLSPKRRVGVGGLLRTNSPEALGLVRPSQVVIVTVAERLSAIQTETRVGSTRRRIGPARTSGNVMVAPQDALPVAAQIGRRRGHGRQPRSLGAPRRASDRR